MHTKEYYAFSVLECLAYELEALETYISIHIFLVEERDKKYFNEILPKTAGKFMGEFI
jgi:hypothetical protein